MTAAVAMSAVAPATTPAVRSDGRRAGMVVLVGRVAAVLVIVLSFGCASGPFADPAATGRWLLVDRGRPSWQRPANPGAGAPMKLGISPLTPGSAGP
jgi:hypothetical protein